MPDYRPTVDTFYHDYNKNKKLKNMLRNEILLLITLKFLADATTGVIISQLMRGYLYPATTVAEGWIAVGILATVSLVTTRELLKRFIDSRKAEQEGKN